MSCSDDGQFLGGNAVATTRQPDSIEVNRIYLYEENPRHGSGHQQPGLGSLPRAVEEDEGRTAEGRRRRMRTGLPARQGGR